MVKTMEGKGKFTGTVQFTQALKFCPSYATELRVHSPTF